MKDDPTCACGIYPFITGPNDEFLPACAWHDSAYLNGSSQQRYCTRKEVDDCFLEQMLRIAGSCKTLQLRAHAYYAVVRALGWMWWEGKE